MIDSDHPKTTPEQVNIQELRVRRDSPNAGSRDVFMEMRKQLKAELIAYADPTLDLTDRNQVRPYVHDCLDNLLAKRELVLNKDEKRQLLDEIVADLIKHRS